MRPSTGDRCSRLLRLLLIAVVAWNARGDEAWADALERMDLNALRATHQAVLQFQQDRQPVELQSRYEDVRTLLHVHSLLSHDSVGTPEEIRQAAIEAGVRVVMFTNHPADDYDYFTDGHHDLKDGVLFIPGAEEAGLLVFPQQSVERRPEFSAQDKVDVVRATDGQSFLCHLEDDDRMEWELQGLTGTEIYNTHADFKDEPRLIRAVRDPLKLMTVLAPAVNQFPQECFAALQDYPADYLRRWDELNGKYRLTGVSANDAHQNNGVSAVVTDDDQLSIRDFRGDELTSLDPEEVPAVRLLMLEKEAGDVVFDLQLDPYVRSFRHVSTHLMMDEFNEAAVRDSLTAGRAYVAFDWMCDPSGFVFQAVSGSEVHPMGSTPQLSDDLRLRSEAPLNGTFRVIHNGQEVHNSRGRRLEFPVTDPGTYRVEVWLNFPDEPRIWILSNPIYVR